MHTTTHARGSKSQSEAKAKAKVKIAIEEMQPQQNIFIQYK